MEHSHGPAFCVHQNHRQTIGGQNCEQQARGSSDQAVARETRFGDFRNAMNKIGVDLAQGNQRPLAPLPDGSQLPEKSGPVLFHCPLRILTGESEIQAPPAIGPGKPARPSAEAMDQARESELRESA